jgi:periplasmic protein TonB
MRTSICSLAIAFIAILPASVYAQQNDKSAETTASADQTFLEFQVEKVVRVKGGRPPEYPARLRSKGLAGEVLVQFVVDERGVAQMNTFKVLRSNDDAFTDAVRAAVQFMAFHPAEVDGRKVKQLVQQPYRFAVHQ